MALFESYERRVDKINAVLKEYGMEKLMHEIEIPLAAVLASMEEYGFRIDPVGIHNYAEELKKQEEEQKRQEEIRKAKLKQQEEEKLATIPVYGISRHEKIKSINDYLAKRDSEWMGKVYRFDCVTHTAPPNTRTISSTHPSTSSTPSPIPRLSVTWRNAKSCLSSALRMPTRAPTAHTTSPLSKTT